MAFFLQGKLWTLPKNTKEEEKTEKLFIAFQQSPCAEDDPSSIEKIKKPLVETNAYCAMQKGFAVITGNSDVVTDDYDDYIGGTYMLDSCIGIAFYCPDQHKLVIAHLDLNIDIQSLANVLTEFKGSKRLEVRIFGGICELGDSNRDDYLLSLEIGKKLYFYLYEHASKIIDIDILSTNTYEKLKTFKEHQLQTTGDLTVGFAINARTGHVLVALQDENKWLPYLKINNAGIFKGPAKRNPIVLELRYYLNISANELIKYYDSSSPKWNKELLDNWNNRSVQGLINFITYQLWEKQNLATNLPDMDNELKTYIQESLNKWLKQSNKDSYLELLLECIVVNLYQTKYKFEPSPFSTDEIQNLFITQLLDGNEIRDWRCQQVRIHIANSLADNCIFKKYDLLSELKNINSDLHLIDELLRYKIIYYQVKKEALPWEKNSPNLLTQLTEITEKNFNTLHEVVEDWLNKKIQQVIHMHISKIIIQQINTNHNKRLPQNEQEHLRRWIQEKLAPHAFNIFPYLHIYAPHFAELKKITKQMASEIAGNFPCSPCMGHALTGSVLNSLEEMLNSWLKTIGISVSKDVSQRDEDTKSEEEEISLVTKQK